nr:GAF sensor protein [uncultured bacterium]
MAHDLFGAAVELLEKIGHDADDTEVDALFGDIVRLAERHGRAGDAAALQSALALIRQSLHDSTLSEKGLSLFIDTTHDLSKTLELQGLFKTLVARVRNLVGANIAWVTILDDEAGIFRTVAAEGYLSPSTTRMTSRFEYGAVGLIMETKSFFDTQDYLNDRRFRHLPELDRTFETENIVSLAGFPILADGEVHGFLFVADRYARKLSGREISVLGSFALHAGIAMRNANAFRLLSEALDEAQRNRNALIEHIQRVEASAAAHDEMTSLLASGGEMQKFLQRMANQIGGVIFLVDGDLNASDEFVSSAYRGRIASEMRTGVIEVGPLIRALSQSRHTGRSEIMTNTPEEQCRVIALHGGGGRGECLVICHQGELDAIEIRNLERSAVALSIARLWNEKRETEKLIASSTLLRHLVLVTPPDPATLSAVRDRLGLHADGPVALALIVVSDLDRASQTTVVREAASRANVLVDLFDDAYVGFGAQEAMTEFQHHLSASAGDWQVGGIVSGPLHSVSETAAEYARLNRALQVVRKIRPLSRFIARSDLDFISKLFETGDAARLSRYMEDVLRPIDAKAPRQGAELKKTLLCYLEGQYSIRKTADALGLHVNTVRQRLDSLQQITGGWEDPAKALEMHIALRLEALFGDRSAM